MAISSSIGSNIFDILFGLQFPWLCYCIFFAISEKKFKANEVQADDLITDVLILLGAALSPLTHLPCAAPCKASSHSSLVRHLVGLTWG